MKQLTGSYCGPAVMQMLASSLGVSVYQETLVDACEARKTVMKEGISLIDLAKGLRKLNPDLIVWAKMDSKIEDIKEMLDFGYPVAVDWQGIFTEDEYGDEIWNRSDKLVSWWGKQMGEPVSVGEQGHYCIAVEINTNKGYLRFADPYGHYAGKDRFVALWEFEERWWDDRIDKDEKGKKKYVLENRLMFVVTKKGDKTPKKLGMVEV